MMDKVRKLFRWHGKVGCDAFAHILKEKTEELRATRNTD
jgi:hypothetical protein